MNVPIYVILKVLFDFALEVWFNIDLLEKKCQPFAGPIYLVYFRNMFLERYE